jgi:glycosyltransferase involved in cell wall biosynthesis
MQPLNAPSIVRYMNEFDVVHAGGNAAAYVMGILRPMIGRVSQPLILYDVHGDAIEESRLVRKGPFDFPGYFNAFQMRFTDNVAVRCADCFITASERIKQLILARNRKVSEEAIEVIPNGVNVELFRPQRAMPQNASASRFTVTYAGSFLPWQGVETLIAATQLLENQDIRFKLIGFKKEDMKSKESIRRQVNSSNIELIDWLPRGELITHLQESDVLIIPASQRARRQREVAFSTTKFAEFAALGKPIIVASIDGISRLVRAYDCGFVCEPTPESTAEVIMQARRTPKEVLERKGMNGRQLAEKELDWRLIARKYLAFLTRVIANRR